METAPEITKTNHALFWNTIDQFVQQGVLFVTGIILARMIEPSQFGLIAMIIVFVAIGQNLMNAGLKSAIVQTKVLNESDCSTVLLANFSLSLILYLTIWTTAPFIAEFYDEQKLISLLRCLSFGLVVQSPSVVQTGLLSRRLEFRTQAKASLTGHILAGVIGVWMAFQGFEAWALVAMSISGKAINTILLWVFAGWHPTCWPSISSVQKLFPFGLSIAACSLLESIFNNLFFLVIGRFHTPADVAFYQRAYGINQIPVNNLNVIVSRTLFPLLCSRHKSPDVYRTTIRKAFRLTAFTILPTMSGLYLCADQLIYLLLGDKWLPSAALLEVMCVVGATLPFLTLNGLIITSQGLGGTAFRIEICKRILLVATICVTASMSVYAMVVGHAVQSACALVVAAFFTGKFSPYTVYEQASDIFPFLTTSLLCILVSQIILGDFQGGGLLRIIAFTALFAFLYLTNSYIFCRETLKDIKKLATR